MRAVKRLGHALVVVALFAGGCQVLAGVDGAPDLICQPGTTQPCYTGPAGTEGMGVCQAGTQTCRADASGFDACVGEVLPSAEDCATPADDDCNGAANQEDAACACGDGIVSGAEQCDDGGKLDSDSCSSTCQEQKVLQVSTGEGHTCALLSGGKVKCWGSNQYGQLGLLDPGRVAKVGDELGEMRASLATVDLGTDATAIAIAAGGYHTCVLLSDGKVKCWGHNGAGQLGHGDTTLWGYLAEHMGDNLPPVELGNGAKAITAGYLHTCALLIDGSVKCWGGNDSGQLGQNNTTGLGVQKDDVKNSKAIDLGVGKIATAITTGSSGLHTCALLVGGGVKCWGDNSVAQLGLGDKESRGNGVVDAADTPKNEMGESLPMVDLGAKAIAIAAGMGHTCALLEGGVVKCWGWNAHGQLGLGDTENRGDNEGLAGLQAVDLAGQKAKAIAAGYWQTCVVLESGKLKCWGSGASGALGLGDKILDAGNDPMVNTVPYLPFVDLGKNKLAVAVASAGNHTCALLDDNGMKCWGRNNVGQLGLEDSADRGLGMNDMGDNLPMILLFSDAW